jgi:hypothetical protein
MQQVGFDLHITNWLCSRHIYSIQHSSGRPIAFLVNTAAVLQQAEGAARRQTPAFPTLYPQRPPGLGGDRNTAGGCGVCGAID